MIPIRVVPEAHSLAGPNSEGEDNRTPTIAALQDCEFVLCVDTLCARKNQAMLVQIWQVMVREGVEPPTLVLVGRRGHNSTELVSQLETTNYLEGRVLVLEGLLDDEANASTATVWPRCSRPLLKGGDCQSAKASPTGNSASLPTLPRCRRLVAISYLIIFLDPSTCTCCCGPCAPAAR